MGQKDALCPTGYRAGAQAGNSLELAGPGGARTQDWGLGEQELPGEAQSSSGGLCVSVTIDAVDSMQCH